MEKVIIFQKDDERGQAVFEFIAFVPFLIILIHIFISISGAINGSINQQKAVRGYYYNIIKWSSHFPKLDDLNNGRYKTFNQISFFTIGWKEKLKGDRPVAPCYLLQSFLGENIDTCEDPTEINDGKSQFVRVYTAYGVCGANYLNQGTQWQTAPFFQPTCHMKR